VSSAARRRTHPTSGSPASHTNQRRASSHLRERTKGESAGAGQQGGRRPRSRRVQSQPELDIGRDRPQPATAPEGGMAPEAQIHQLVPELGVAETVDMPCQIVEITPLDELSRNGRAHRSAGGLTG
jgi:hypothetical protein